MDEFINELNKMAEKAAYEILKSKSRDEIAKVGIDRWYEKLPDFNEIYEETIRQHYRVRVHAEVNAFPYEILRTKAPNQSKEEWDYQRGLYEPYTNSTWGAARNRTKIIGNKQNYSIQNWDAAQKEYFYKNYPVYHSLESYFFDIVREAKIDYPNQVLLIEPMEIPGSWQVSEEEEDELVFIPDDTVEIEPIATIIQEKDVVKYKEGKHLFYILSWEKDNLLFRYVDTENFYEIKQTGKDQNNKPIFDIRLIYRHNWGYCPARKLGGRPTIHDGQLLYMSYFTPAIADLNDVIRLSSNLMMSSCAMLFPVRVTLVDKCKYRNEQTGSFCDGGRIFDDGEYKTCPSCNGSGRANNHSPTGVYEVMQPDGLTEAANLALSPPVQFIGPSTEIYTKVEETIQIKKESAFSFLVPKKNTTAKSATEAENEREDFHSFIQQFSNEFFDLLEFAIEAIGFMRYGDAFQMPSINRPTTFAYMTNAEITEEIKRSKEGNLPQSYTRQLVYESANTRFNSSPEVEKYIDFCIQVDGLWNMTDADIRAAVNVTLTPTDAIIHQRITYLITQCEIENPNFWELEFSEREKMIRAKAELIAQTLAPKLSNQIQM